MKRHYFLVFLGIVALLAMPIVAGAADNGSWTGEIVGFRCKIPNSKRPAHDCSQRCVKNGQPMGLLTDSGTLLRLKPDPRDPTPYEALRRSVGTRRAISGSLAERDGMKVVTVTGSKAAS